MNIKPMLKIVTVLAVSAALFLTSACTISKHEAISRRADMVRTEYENMLNEFKNKKRLDIPESEPLEIAIKDAWLYEQVTSDYSNMRFRQVLKKLFPGTPIVYASNIPSAYNPMVVAPPQASIVKDHLDSIAIQVNLGWAIKRGVLYISANQVAHYPVPLFGSGGGGAGGDGIKNSIFVSADNLGAASPSGGFTNALEGQISAYDELAAIASSVTGAKRCDDDQSKGSLGQEDRSFPLDPIKAERPCYSLSGAGNILVMSARPQAHALFSAAYDPWYKSVNTQVQIKLKILQTDVTDIAQQAIDPSILRSAAISTAAGLSHFEGLGVQATSNSQNFVSFDESANGLTFTFDEGSRYAGSELIIKALNQVGKTFVASTQEFTARNNQLNSFIFEEETPFLESVSISTTNTSATSSTTVPTLISNATLTGSALNVVATVTGNEIGLRIVVNEKILGEREDYEIATADTMVQGSRYGWSSSNSTFTPTLRDGDVALLVSSEKKSFDVDNAKNDFLPLLGDTYSAKGRVFNTLYLIEAHIIR